LTRLPKSGVPISWVKDVSLTARTFGAEEGLRVGFVTEIAETKQAAIDLALRKASIIAEKSPIAVQGTKNIIDFSRNHSIDDGLVYTAGMYYMLFPQA
jgi:delta(3,5)-delta(2,4)-dienoyl-CoA isomerase